MLRGAAFTTLAAAATPTITPAAAATFALLARFAGQRRAFANLGLARTAIRRDVGFGFLARAALRSLCARRTLLATLTLTRFTRGALFAPLLAFALFARLPRFAALAFAGLATARGIALRLGLPAASLLLALTLALATLVVALLSAL